MSVCLSPIKRELSIFFGFTWRDWSVSIIVGCIHSIDPLRNSRLSFADAIPRISFLILYLTLFLYFFNLTSQIYSVDEDAINKPDRPIPKGLVSLEGAKRRWIILVFCFIGVSAFEPTLLPLILFWIFNSIFQGLATPAQHWLMKNVYSMPAGAWSLLVGTLKCIDPACPVDLNWMTGLLIWIGLTSNIQDLRDLAGDAATNRKTLPVLYGDTGSRYIITFGLMPSGVVALWYGGVLAPAPITVLGLHIYIGYRIMRGGGSYADHKTYMLYTYAFALLVFLGAFKENDVERLVIDSRQFLILAFRVALSQFSRSQ